MDKISHNASLFFDIKVHCNNLEDMIGSRKYRLFISKDENIEENFEHIYSTSLCPEQKDEIIFEIRVDLENVFL